MHFVDVKGILTGGKGHYGMNIYRGCSHGCIYCDSRSRCYHFTHAFEDIEVKQNAPELLEQALRFKRQKAVIGTGAMSDPYMHCEEQLGLTRKCLEIICFDMGLTLREGDREYYYAALDRHFPGLKERYIRTYGNAYEVPSPNRSELMNLFQSFCREHRMMYRPEDCFEYMDHLPDRFEQMSFLNT